MLRYFLRFTFSVYRFCFPVKYRAILSNTCGCGISRFYLLLSSRECKMIRFLPELINAITVVKGRMQMQSKRLLPRDCPLPQQRLTCPWL